MNLKSSEKLKTCSKCGETKPLEDFHRDKQRRDGRKNQCKACGCAASRAYSSSHLPQERDRQRRYKTRNPEWVKKMRIAQREKSRIWYAENREYFIEYHRSWREQHPEKERAHHAVNNAIRDGRLEKPSVCERCNEIVAGDESHRLHGHHADYSKPLDVEWLCASCHAKEHAVWS